MARLTWHPGRSLRRRRTAQRWAPEAGSSAEAAIVIGEAADADVAPSPPVVSTTPAPVAAEVAAVPVEERPVAASIGMADASAPSASEEVGAGARSVHPGGGLVAVRRSPEARRQLLRFRTREASDPVFVLDDEQEDQSWDELREHAEATVGSLRSSLEVLCRDVPKILQVTVSGIPFPFCERGVRRDALSPSSRT
jgi:sugar/nucleoside kinase (ribokinase family)